MSPLKKSTESVFIRKEWTCIKGQMRMKLTYLCLLVKYMYESRASQPYEFMFHIKYFHMMIHHHHHHDAILRVLGSVPLVAGWQPVNQPTPNIWALQLLSQWCWLQPTSQPTDQPTGVFIMRHGRGDKMHSFLSQYMYMSEYIS